MIASANNFSSWSFTNTGLACSNTIDGKLVIFEEGKGTLDIVHDPWRPVPAIGGHLSPSPGPADRGAIDRRNDVATFNTLELKKDLQLSKEHNVTLKHPDIFNNKSLIGIRLAYFDYFSREEYPSLEITVNIASNGIATMLEIDYPGFSIVGKLREISLLKRKNCSD